jgi:uncharacterized protein (TIGR02145 family)
MKKSILALSLSMAFATSLFTACGGSSSDADDYDGYNPSSGRSGGKGEFFKTGSMVDPRDGKTYKTVKIGDQVWMAENLAFYDTLGIPELAKAPSNDYSGWSGDIMPVASIADSEETPAAKEPSGQTYTYDAAMNFGYYSDTSYNDGICPPGWHLPVMAEFDVLKSNVLLMCDSTFPCAKLEDGWKSTETFWTSTPANGVRINSDYGYSYRSNSYDAVSYTVNVEKYDAFVADFSGKTSKLNVRCVQGAVLDSVSALKSFMAVREKNIEAMRLADSVWQYIQRGAKNYFNDSLEYSYFTDPRDGNVYGYLKIGSYFWMAENMRYTVGDAFCDSYLKCNASSHQDTLSYFDIGLSYNASEKASVCPDGWHLPSKEEWLDLRAASEKNGDFFGDDGMWDLSRVTPTNSTGFTMLTTTYRSARERSAFNEAAFWVRNDSLYVRLKIDTVYIDDPVEETIVVAVPEDSTADSLVVADSTVVSDSTAADSLPEVPERRFTLDTTRTEFQYYFYYEYDWMGSFGLQTTSSSYDSFSVRCVKDY